MNQDTVVFIAFCLFAGLLGLRWRLGWPEKRAGKHTERTAGETGPETAGPGKPVREQNDGQGRERLRRFFRVVQLLVLAGLMMGMSFALIRDFADVRLPFSPRLILRCLIFVCTIYIFAAGCKRVFVRKNQGKRRGNRFWG